jgi:hypothetical protein
MKIIYISLFADFGADGDIEKGYSYEFSHFWDAWRILVSRIPDLEVTPWWIDKSDPSMLEHMIDDKPDLIWCMPVNWSNDAPFQLLNKAVNMGIPIVQFDCDPLRRFNKGGDPWILERYHRKLATHFLTPAPHTIPLYEAQGMPVKVMYFGCPSWIDRCNIRKNIDVSFVGQCHGLRQQVVDSIRKAGINIKCYGHFWSDHPDNHPIVTEDKMCEIFNRSKINLNFTWISQPPYQHQWKGRHAELAGAGAFQIATYGAEEMQGFDDFLLAGRDFIQVYTIDEMIDNIKYYLANHKERKRIADNAYARRQDILCTTQLEKFINEYKEMFI